MAPTSPGMEARRYEDVAWLWTLVWGSTMLGAWQGGGAMFRRLADLALRLRHSLGYRPALAIGTAIAGDRPTFVRAHVVFDEICEPNGLNAFDSHFDQMVRKNGGYLMISCERMGGFVGISNSREFPVQVMAPKTNRRFKMAKAYVRARKIRSPRSNRSHIRGFFDPIGEIIFFAGEEPGIAKVAVRELLREGCAVNSNEELIYAHRENNREWQDERDARN